MAIRQPKAHRQAFPVSKYDGRPMTEAEYLALPEEKPYLEYVDGVVLQKPMPNKDHVLLVEEIIIAIGLYRREHGGSSGPEGRVRLPDGTGYRLPDTAYWTPTRRHEDDGVPSLAVEVRSPDQTLESLRRKCRAFRRNGVDVCWLIDPVSRGAEIFEGSRDAERAPSDGVLTTAIMPGFELPLDELFSVLGK
jgi:Uma2 family endonuclease